MPELAKGEQRPDEDIPFTTKEFLSVLEGMIIPPGHMQKEKTPRDPILHASE